MAQFTFTIQADSLVGLIEKLKQELQILTEKEEMARQYDQALATKLPPNQRKRKRWTEWEINFLIDNYQRKTIPWIAKALCRDVTAVRAKLSQLYREVGIPRKTNRVKIIKD